MKDGKEPNCTDLMRDDEKKFVPKLKVEGIIYESNLTKREYFGGLAMQGLMTSQNQEGEWRHDIKTCAEISVKMADALLAELEK
jgi:hypothetical protein